MDSDLGNYLAGFIDGEGSFNITPHKVKGKSYYCCRFAVGLHIDDLPILTELQIATGIGNISCKKSKATWSVTSTADCLSLIDILEQYPLRARKLNDYRTWRRAVFVQNNHRHERNSAKDKRLISLMRKLVEDRVYSNSLAVG